MQSKEKKIRKDFMQINVTFYFLYLLEPTKLYREKFDDISKVVRVKTENLTKIYDGFDFVDETAFIWDQIPGNDSERLIEFLKQNFDIDWVKTAKIHKIDHDNAIGVFTEKNSLSLKLNPEKTKVNLTIDEVQRDDEFVVKTKNNQLKIYPTSNSEEWCKLKKDFEGDEWEVKYYKERIILKVTTKIDAENLNDLFKKAKKKRKKLLEHKLANLDDIEIQWCEICECIQRVYMYPLIEVEKDYKLDDFDLEDEAITTFFYEIPDVGDINRFLIIFPIKYKKVLMRVSGPSVMTTKMSDIMRSKLINMLYESALYKMRETERETYYCEKCKKISGSNYEYLRKYIAEIFFSIESGTSGIESGSSFQILSFISAFGALASILGISYAVFHILPFPLELLKTSFSTLLFFLTISMLGSIVGIDFLKKKFY